MELCKLCHLDIEKSEYWVRVLLELEFENEYYHYKCALKVLKLIVEEKDGCEVK